MSVTIDAGAAYQARLDARAGILTGPTANLAPGHVQANLAILPEELAHDFLRFCQRNPKPCPLIAVSETGDPSLPELGGILIFALMCLATGYGGMASSYRSLSIFETCGTRS